METIQRKALAHYLQVGEGYIRLGRDLEAYTPKLRAKVEKPRNILGATQVYVTGYEKQGTVAPYFARKGEPLFEKLQAIADGGLILEDCKASVVEAKLWLARGDTAPAIREDCFLEVTDYGGDTAGYRLGFVIHYTGNREAGIFHTGTNTFTPDKSNE